MIKIIVLPIIFFAIAIFVALPLWVDVYRASAEARARREEVEL